MPRESPYLIELSPGERRELEARVRKYTSPYRDVIRAKIVLLAAQGLSNDQIAARLDMPRQIVSKWRKRFYENGFPGLDELPRGGAPTRFSPPVSSFKLRRWPVNFRILSDCPDPGCRSQNSAGMLSLKDWLPRSAVPLCGAG